MIRTVNASQLLRAAIELALVVLLMLVMRQGIGQYFWLYLASEILAFLYVVNWLKRLEGFGVDALPSLSMHIVPIVRKGLTFAIPLYFVNVFYNIDILYLNRFASAEQIGIYSVGMTLSLLIWQFPAFLTFVVFSYSVSAEDGSRFSRALWRNTWRVMLASLVPLLVIVAAGRVIVPIVYGRAYAPSYEIFLLLLPGVYLMIFYKMLNGDMAGRGRPMVNFWVILPALVLKIVLNTVYVPSGGVRAAALTSGICYSLVACAYVIVYHWLCLQRGVTDTLDS
jgi:O-antigen/teichoic acid export membrane protein